MERFPRSAGDLSPVRPEEGPRETSPRPSSRSRAPKAYRICDGLTAALIFWMIVFTPWAFGTTQQWSLWTMHISGYLLGALLAAKWVIRYRTGYTPVRWGQSADAESAGDLDSALRRDPLTLGLAALTIVILLYTLISALNPRAQYLPWQRVFEYRDYIKWLPHSYDPASTWNALWMYLGLACFFWATRDWLLTKSSKERRTSTHRQRDVVQLESSAAPEEFRSGRRPSSLPEGEERVFRTPEIPARLQALLWVLCLNGALLALESILQRLSGTNKLLWLVVPTFNNTAEVQFGPYSYRANASTYFNLIWPVCLGFWLVLRERARPSLKTGHRMGSGRHIVLLPGAVLMAACPIISTTRGGTIVAIAAICLSLGIMLRMARKESRWFGWGAVTLFVTIVGFAAFLGLKDLVPRFKTIFTDQMSHRTEIYENALPMAREFPVFGTGPGTFGTMYQFYRKNVSQEWHAYLHDDWLETRITFGWIGFSVILLMLGLVLARWFWGGGLRVPREFTAMLWVAIGGFLLHAKFDFPLQIYSLFFLFLLLSAILFSISARAAR